MSFVVKVCLWFDAEWFILLVTPTITWLLYWKKKTRCFQVTVSSVKELV